MTTASQIQSVLAVKPQAFEAEVFGAPVWRLEIGGPDFPAARELDDLIVQARAGKTALIACRLPSGSPVAALLSQAGFRKVERLVTLNASMPNEAEMPAGICIAEASDEEAATQIGRSAFLFDRYHADPNIPGAIADEIKARWVHNGITGRADAALIAHVNGAAAGFVLCMRRGKDAVIDLIGVSGDFQGQGLGRKLIEGALAHYAGRAQVMWVGTQEDNLVSLALYRRAGFISHDVAETWHWTA